MKNTFIRVCVMGIGSGTVTRAAIRFQVPAADRADSNSGGRIRPISDCGWDELAVTFQNQPAIDGPVLDTVGAVDLGDVVEFDVTSAVPGDGIYCFAIDSLSADGVDYLSLPRGKHRRAGVHRRGDAVGVANRAHFMATAAEARADRALAPVHDRARFAIARQIAGGKKLDCICPCAVCSGTAFALASGKQSAHGPARNVAFRPETAHLGLQSRAEKL